jgi:hypothetical protein
MEENKMKRVLTGGMAAALMLATSLTPASAGSPSLPSSLYGRWCQVETKGKTTRYARGRCEGSDTSMTISPGSMDGWEWGCEVKKVSIVGRAYEVLSKCGGEGMRSDEKATIWLDGRFLMYHRVQSNEYPEYSTMECRDHRPSDGDPDPVTLTLLTFDNTFAVTHVTRNGKTYKRGDQYRDLRVWSDDDGTHWAGTSKRVPSKRMVGSLTLGQPNKYVEKTYEGGRPTVTVTATCEYSE